MAGNLGRSTDPLTHYGREIVFEERTSDPVSTSEGDMWLRVDIAPEANQLATLRFDHGSGTWDIPIFETGTSLEDVEEVYRIPVSGQLGYVPGALRDDAAFSQLSFSHAGATYGLHNDTELPDLVLVEDFERSTPWGDYTFRRSSSNGGTTTSPALEGDTSGTLQQDGTDREWALYTGSEPILEEMPEKGDTFAALVYTDDADAMLEVAFGAGGTEAFYIARVNVRDNELRLEARDSGNSVALNSTSQTFGTGSGYDVQIEWEDNDDITARVFAWDLVENERGSELASVTANDARFSENTGFGWGTGGGSNETGVYDFYRIIDKGGDSEN